MNVEQNLIMRDRDLFSNAHNALTNKIVQELVNLYASIIRSTDDEIIRTELEREYHIMLMRLLLNGTILLLSLWAKMTSSTLRTHDSLSSIVTVVQELRLSRNYYDDTIQTNVSW